MTEGAWSMVESSSKESKESNPLCGWEGAVIAVLGLYDKGKTFVLNSLTNTNFASGKKIHTKGLSFKHVQVEGGTNFIILDSEGSYSPVKVENELSVIEKETTELFLQELIFEMSDYFICVVNDFTSLDQRYLDKLTRNLQNSKKDFREVIVVHNCKEVVDPKILEHVWDTQVTSIYAVGTMQETRVAANNPVTGILEDKAVAWFKTPYSRHVLVANHDSDIGEELNPWAFSLLRYLLKSVFVPVDRQFSVVDSVIHYSNLKLANYFKQHPKLKLFKTDNPFVNCIKTCVETGGEAGELRLPQVSIDASGIMLTRPDSYLPMVDIIRNDHEGSYVVYMDVPGLTRQDVKLSRQNVITIIKGQRDPVFNERDMQKVVKQERKYGNFTMTFKIPEQYERKWDSVNVENGVLIMKFLKDVDEDEH